MFPIPDNAKFQLSYAILDLNNSKSIGPNFDWVPSKIPEKLTE